ncbi:MAG: hypothetical protein ABIF40_03905 [archaeon]
MQQIIENLKQDKDLKLLETNVHDLEEQEHPNVPNVKLYSTFTEIELETTELKKIISLAFDYMPSNIEIIEPAGMDIDLNEVSDILNDLLARLHQYDSIMKNLHAENTILKSQKK